jgi:hypothetical protein
MDHSLIIGLYKNDEESAPKRKKRSKKDRKKEKVPVPEQSPTAGGHVEGRTILMSADGTETFVVGIIDILQDYNMKKKLAHVVKSVLHDSVRYMRIRSAHEVDLIAFSVVFMTE